MIYTYTPKYFYVEKLELLAPVIRDLITMNFLKLIEIVLTRVKTLIEMEINFMFSFYLKFHAVAN